MSVLERGSELWLKYSDKVKEYNKSLVAIAKKQEMTEREEAKWLNWEEILAVRDKLKPATPDDFLAYQDWVILCLYTMLPPLRADFSPMRIYDEMPPADVSGNFVVLSPNKNSFVLQEYKTSGTYGRQEIEIPDELLEVLYEWVIYNPTGWLLVREDGEPYTEGNLSQRVGRIMERATRGPEGSPGKNCGITMFRHAYKTWLHAGEPTILDAEAEAKKMLHSPQMAQKYRRPKKE
jgi:integrase